MRRCDGASGRPVRRCDGASGRQVRPRPQVGPDLSAPVRGRGAHWGRLRVIGVGNDALGQVNNLPQCGLTCPNGCFPAPMRLAAPGRMSCARRRTCSRSDTGAVGSFSAAEPPFSQHCRPACGPLSPCAALWWAVSTAVPVRRAQFSQRYHAFAALPHFASVIILAKRRYPFENSASLVKRPGRLPRGCGSPLKTRHCLQNDPCAVPTARIQRQSSGTAVGAAPCERPNWLAFCGGGPSGGRQTAGRLSGKIIPQHMTPPWRPGQVDLEDPA